MHRKVIPAVLVYVTTPTQVLMMHRTIKKNDVHQGKWNGLGGKLEPGESPLEAAVRELFEESALRLEPGVFSCLGVLQFPEFKSNEDSHEDWLVWVFKAQVDDSLSESALPSSNEGVLRWIPQEDLLTLALWEGDRIFLPKVFSKSKNEPRFFGTFWYEEGKLKRHEFY